MDARLYNVEEERDAKIVAWRLMCFEAIGVGNLTASCLAVRRDIDRAHASRMVANGATDDELRAILL